MTIIQTQEALLWKKIQRNVPQSSTVEIEKIALSSFRAVKYFIEIYNYTENKFKSFEVFGSRKSSTKIVATVFSKLGDSLNIEIKLELIASEVVLSMINSEPFDLSVIIMKSKL